MTENESKITITAATLDDCPMLAAMNKQLIEDEGGGNRMSVPELEGRVRDWLQKGVYTAHIFKLGGDIIGYALVDLSDMWMRHFFICREYRRRGYGKAAINLLLEQLGLDEIGLSCLTKNIAGQAFWRSFTHEIYSVKFNIRKSDD